MEATGLAFEVSSDIWILATAIVADPWKIEQISVSTAAIAKRANDNDDSDLLTVEEVLTTAA